MPLTFYVINGLLLRNSNYAGMMMKWSDALRLFKRVYEAIQEDLGYSPVKLLKVIKEYPDFLPQLAEVPRSIHEGHVVKWHEWGERRYGLNIYSKSSMMCWCFRNGYYESFHLAMPEFDSFGLCEEVPYWACEIQDVVGLSSAKSELHKFTSLDDLVETNSSEMINIITEEQLQKNLAHNEIRIIHQGNRTTDHFSSYLWDKRIFLSNSGGGHHFAAARYIASRIKQKVPLKGKLMTYSINPKSLDALCEKFSIFVISNGNPESNLFNDAMRAFRATYGWRSLPRPYDSYRAIFLPKDEPRSILVANVLLDAGVYDLGAYLAELVNRQKPIGLNCFSYQTNQF